MSDSIERRDLLIGGLAAGAAFAAATTSASAAEPLDPHRITLHVLDVYSGHPGGNVRVDLSMLEGEAYRPIKTVTTTASGRPAAPVLSGEDSRSANTNSSSTSPTIIRGSASSCPIRRSSTRCRCGSRCSNWAPTTSRSC